jgi:hypothetical protein
MSEFVEATLNKFDWWDCCCQFKCDCGKEIVVDQENGETVCRCGRAYRIVARLEVKKDDNT